MAKTRIPETEGGIQGEFDVSIYDQMQKRFRDKGWIETPDILKLGITNGCALEIGPGPGYLGLEWLKHTQGTTLKGLEISADMITVAERNAAAYGLSSRSEYIRSKGDKMPFENGIFDGVFTNGSLHEWENPRKMLNEMWRVLRPGGRVFISDLRRDMPTPVKLFMWIVTSPKEIRPGLISSINSAYTFSELKELIQDTKLENCVVSGNALGLVLTGMK